MVNTLKDFVQKDKRRAAILLGVIVVLVIIWVARMSSPARQQAALARALENTAAAETFHVNANLDLNLPVVLRTSERPIVGVTAQVEGDVDNRGERPQLDGTLRTEARGRGMVLFADGELRILPDSVAFYLDNLPVLLNPRGTLVEKWTRVEVPLLKTNSPADVRAVLSGVFENMEYRGSESLPGDDSVRAKRYAGSFTDEEEDVLADALRQGNTGNRGLHVLTRLLRAFDVRSFNVWTAGDKLRRIEATFEINGDEEPRAILTIEFDEYGKAVTIEEPPRELTVDPKAFTGIFGRGELEGF